MLSTHVVGRRQKVPGRGAAEYVLATGPVGHLEGEVAATTGDSDESEGENHTGNVLGEPGAYFLGVYAGRATGTVIGAGRRVVHDSCNLRQRE